MKRVAISQSNYIPWKGYFDLIASVDVFVLYDDMQYTKRDWRNRNKIKTQNGTKWISVPVEVKGKYHQKINATLIADKDWPTAHWNQLHQSYRTAPFFEEISIWLKPLYLETEFNDLSSWNRLFIESICSYLKINTQIRDSREFDLVGDRSLRLVNVCEQLGAQEYTTGPAAKDYMNEDAFTRKNISIRWTDYSDYAEYQQLNGPFEHSVTILDLLFNVGPSASDYMKFVK